MIYAIPALTAAKDLQNWLALRGLFSEKRPRKANQFWILFAAVRKGIA